MYRCILIFSLSKYVHGYSICRIYPETSLLALGKWWWKITSIVLRWPLKREKKGVSKATDVERRCYYHAGCRPAELRRWSPWQLDLGHLQTMVSASPTTLHTFHLYVHVIRACVRVFAVLCVYMCVWILVYLYMCERMYTCVRALKSAWG